MEKHFITILLPIYYTKTSHNGEMSEISPGGFLEVYLQLFHSHMHSCLQRNGGEKMFVLQLNIKLHYLQISF